MDVFVRLTFVVAVLGICAGAVGQPRLSSTLFTGHVVDESGWPMKDVSVNLMQRAGNFSSHSIAVTDDQGSFTLHLVDGATGAVFANDDGERVVDSKVVSGRPEPVELRLKKTGRKLRGTVVDEAGQPVPNALVGLAANTREGAENQPHFRVGLAEAGMMRLTADENGVFETDKLPALPIIVWAAKPGDKKGLLENFYYSAKPAVLDLGDGDVLDYQAKLDPPPATAPRVLGNVPAGN